VSEPAGDGAKIHAGVDEFGRRAVAERVESGASESKALCQPSVMLLRGCRRSPRSFVGTELGGGSPRLVASALGSVAAMPKPPIPSEFVEVLKRPNPAVMGSVRPDGTPVTVATWYLWDDSGRVLLNLASSRKRLEYMRTNPRVSLTVLDGDNWYRHVSVVGSVTLVDDTDQHDVDRLTRHYTGQPWTGRDQHRVSAWLGVDFYHVWGF
jgi:PPOX class probable F420-dependent enzyme